MSFPTFESEETSFYQASFPFLSDRQNGITPKSDDKSLAAIEFEREQSVPNGELPVARSLSALVEG